MLTNREQVRLNNSNKPMTEADKLMQSRIQAAMEKHAKEKQALQDDEEQQVFAQIVSHVLVITHKLLDCIDIIEIQTFACTVYLIVFLVHLFLVFCLAPVLAIHLNGRINDKNGRVN